MQKMCTKTPSPRALFNFGKQTQHTKNSLENKRIMNYLTEFDDKLFAILPSEKWWKGKNYKNLNILKIEKLFQWNKNHFP